MTAPESSRLALYNGLRDALGPELADGLMRYLPSTQASELVTRADFFALRSEMDEVKDEIRHLSQRIDRLYNAMVGGFAAMVAALIASGLLR